MNPILVDANVLISFLTDRNARQREEASALLRGAVAQEHMLVLHSMTIVEMILRAHTALPRGPSGRS